MRLEYLDEELPMGTKVRLRDIKAGDLFVVLDRHGVNAVYRAINSFHEGMTSLYMEVEVRTPYLKFKEGDTCWFTKDTCHPNDVVIFIENQS